MLSLAASNYSNSAPLVWSFWHGTKRHQVDLITDTAPSVCAEMLRDKFVDVALTPVIEYQRIENTLIVPNICIAAKTQVRSVILVTKGGELKNARSIALDASSRTSVALTQIIFRELFDTQPEFVSHHPNIERMLETHDAALLIGDPALRLDRTKYRVFDIVELWRSLTNCGFVFAFWLVRAEAIERAREIDFVAARDEGLMKTEEIMQFYASDVGLEKKDFYSYLTENITYTLDEDLLKGLTLFYQLAYKNDLINRLSPLRFI